MGDIFFFISLNNPKLEVNTYVRIEANDSDE